MKLGVNTNIDDQSIFELNKKYFATPIQEFVYYDKYSRFDNDKGRREIWPETVDRTVNYLRKLSKHRLSESDYSDIHSAILNMEVAPSMRLMAVAGPAADRAPESIYNCCYIPISSISSMVELLWVSMCGVGAGYSVESRYVGQLPRIEKQHKNNIQEYIIPDTTEGWCHALSLGLDRWFAGLDIVFDYSKIRKKGTVLKTKGGTASGPQVLKDLLEFAKKLIIENTGNYLSPVDVFDICTKIGDAAVSGGSRRSAQLCMFDLEDNDMINAKSGEFWIDYPHRANANISVVLEKKLPRNKIEYILNTMFNNETGEPGIVSRYAMNKGRSLSRREMAHGGVNACSEINLQGATSDGRLGGQFCNLSSVNIRPNDTVDELKNKVRIATIIGTIQSMATNFKMLSPEWKEICEEERLLGVSLVGVLDNEFTRNPTAQSDLRKIAERTNKEYADKLNINQAAAITTIKPAGNSSVMYGTARGINARYSPYYIRRVRVNEDTPIFDVLQQSGIPIEKDIVVQNGTWVAEFYEQSPPESPTVNDVSALDQLQNWKDAKLNWAHHNISVTIEYTPDEEDQIIDWVYDNQDIINGIAFLPRSNHVYKQAPYEEISQNDYLRMSKDYPEIDFSLLKKYEKSDMTYREIECSAGVCDLF